MPHLMFETFMSQWVWLAFFIFGLYFKLVTELIPKVSNAYKARRNLEEGDVKLTTIDQHPTIHLEIKKPAIQSKDTNAYTKSFN